jgi:SAM-dependent methyltransferase
MNLNDVIQRTPNPRPWAEGEKIPWNDPSFSARMLREHLSQAHNAASRRFDLIDRMVEWLHGAVLEGKAGRVLDLGCGPGFYTSRLARLGHTSLGIDFSPASVDYARSEAQKAKLACDYRLEDVRTADFGAGWDMVMFIYGELNVFKPAEAQAILNNSCAALVPGGKLVLEVHHYKTIQRLGHKPRTWFGEERGLFGDSPYLCLYEAFWDEPGGSATERYYVVDAASGGVSEMAATTQAYTGEQYRQMLGEAGFSKVKFHPSLCGCEDAQLEDFFAIVAEK